MKHYTKQGFTLLELLITLIVVSILFITIQYILKIPLRAKSETISTINAIMIMNDALIFANKIEIIDSTHLQVDRALYHCQDNRLYVTPGFQLLDNAGACTFKRIKHVIYIIINKKAYILAHDKP